MQAHAAALAAVQAHFNTPQNSFGGRGSGPLAMQAIQEQVWQLCIPRFLGLCSVATHMSTHVSRLLMVPPALSTRVSHWVQMFSYRACD